MFAPHALPATHAPALRWACVPLASVLRCFHPRSPVKTVGAAGGWFSSLHHFLLPDSCWREECTSRVPTEKPNLGDNQKCLTVNIASGREPGRLPCPHWPPSPGLSSQLSHPGRYRKGTHKVGGAVRAAPQSRASLQQPLTPCSEIPADFAGCTQRNSPAWGQVLHEHLLSTTLRSFALLGLF